MTPSSDARFTPFRERIHAIFGMPVHKVTLEAGFTCPNRDGTLAQGGCSYCNVASFSPPTLRARRPVTEQLRAGIARKRRARPGVGGFLAYFQPFSNTYAPVERLRALYEEALAVEGVVGLAIGTRPDCVPEPVVALLAEIAARTAVFLELGLETASDATLARLDRGHDAAAFVDAIERLDAARRAPGGPGTPEPGRPGGLALGAHVILGLPGEGATEVRATADLLAAGGVDSVKVHHFYVAPRTRLADAWRRGEATPPTLEAFARLAADLLERLPAPVAIERLWGELDARRVLAPHWRVGPDQVRARIVAELRRRGSRQGSRALTEVTS